MNNQNNRSNKNYKNEDNNQNNRSNKNYNNEDNNNNFFTKLLVNVASNIKETNNEELSKSYHLLCKLLSNRSYRISFNQLNYVRTNLGLTKRSYKSNNQEKNILQDETCDNKNLETNNLN